MHVVCRVLALVATLCCVVQMTEGAPSRERRGVSSRNRPGTPVREWYDWPCPRLLCPSTEGCSVVEVVMWVHGGRLCEGCPYCVDRPFRGIDVDVRAQRTKDGRFKRSTAKISVDTMPIAQNEACSFASCPLKRPTLSCSKSSILDGYLHGNKCIVCAFCSDDVTDTSDDVTDSSQDGVQSISHGFLQQ